MITDNLRWAMVYIHLSMAICYEGFSLPELCERMATLGDDEYVGRGDGMGTWPLDGESQIRSMSISFSRLSFSQIPLCGSKNEKIIVNNI